MPLTARDGEQRRPPDRLSTAEPVAGRPPASVPVRDPVDTASSIAPNRSPAAYRPLTYTQPVSVSEVHAGFLSVGNETARETAMRAAAAGRLQRTILVHGPRGAGKSAFVDDLLALLLCGAAPPSARPCNACRACRDARARSHPDLVIGSPERWRDSRSTGESIVGAARRWLLESSGTPIAGERRVILIEGVDRSNEQTQNALLKALEEPSARQVFVLVADDIGRVLPTIMSRAQPLRIGAIPRATLVAWLMDHEHLPADGQRCWRDSRTGCRGGPWAMRARPRWSSGGGGHRLSCWPCLLADGPTGSDPCVTCSTSPAHSEPSSPRSPTRMADDAPRTTGAQQRARAVAIVEVWRSLARDLLVSALDRAGTAPTAHLLDDLAATSRRLEPAALARFLLLLDRIEEGLMQNAAPRLALEIGMLGWPALPADPPAERMGR